MMQLTFKHYGKSKLAGLCLYNRLYVAGYELKSWLEYLKYCNENLQLYRNLVIIVAFANDKPVGIILKTYCVMVFVKKEYRRKGIGTSLFSELYLHSQSRGLSKEYTVTRGINGSISFFNNLKKYNPLKIKIIS
jgi:GNAT superfamily N-acetyltransferase